jgi:hypothetical protein
MNHINEEGVLDRAARLKRDVDAKAEAVLSGLKLQRAILATALLAAGGAAGYFHVQAGKAADSVTALTESSQRDLTAAKASVDRSENDLNSAKAKLTELESARREEGATLSAKVSMLEGQVATYRDEKVALQAKVDALQVNSAPQVTVYGTNAGVSTETVAPIVQETKKSMTLAADKDTLVTLAQWSKSMANYSKSSGPGSATVSALRRFREWGKANSETLRARVDAKGWSSDPQVQQTLRRLGSVPIELVKLMDWATKKPAGTINGQTFASYALKELDQYVEVGYADTQVAGYIMSDAKTVGTVKKCNE